MRNENYCKINSINNDIQLRKDEMDSSMSKVGLSLYHIWRNKNSGQLF